MVTRCTAAPTLSTAAAAAAAAAARPARPAEVGGAGRTQTPPAGRIDSERSSAPGTNRSVGNSSAAPDGHRQQDAGELVTGSPLSANFHRVCPRLWLDWEDWPAAAGLSSAQCAWCAYEGEG